jgi:hypothetical protein
MAASEAVGEPYGRLLRLLVDFHDTLTRTVTRCIASSLLAHGIGMWQQSCKGPRLASKRVSDDIAAREHPTFSAPRRAHHGPRMQSEAA